MDQKEKRLCLIKYLTSEQPRYRGIEIPPEESGQRKLLRSLLNVRMPGDADEDFLKVQDEYLKEEIREKGITRLSDLSPSADGLYIWQGDITTLECDAIVNAAYACVNYGEAVCPEQIKERSVCIDGDIGEVLARLK